MSKYEQPIVAAAEGAAILGVAAETNTVEQVFEDVAHAAGTDVAFQPEELSGLHGALGNAIEAVEPLALPVATVAIMAFAAKNVLDRIRGTKARRG